MSENGTEFNFDFTYPLKKSNVNRINLAIAELDKEDLFKMNDSGLNPLQFYLNPLHEPVNLEKLLILLKSR
ncbi:MAG: hypothetical protein ACTSRK_17130 [Promethearchaeota archaeon]